MEQTIQTGKAGLFTDRTAGLGSILQTILTPTKTASTSYNTDLKKSTSLVDTLTQRK